MSPQFLDTNVLLYAYDADAGHRHDRAADLVLNLARTQQAAASVQVLQEFYVNAVAKIARPLAPGQAMERLSAFARWTIYSPLAADVVAAAQLSQQYQLSFWDAMIVLSAKRLKCAVLWTEDLNAGQVIDGVTIRNPFTE